MLGLEILTWLDDKERGEHETFTVANSLISAGVEPHRAMPDRYAAPDGVVEGEQDAIDDPEAQLDLSGVTWEMPTEEEFEETQRLLMEMAQHETTTVRDGRGAVVAGGGQPAEDDREWV